MPEAKKPTGQSFGDKAEAVIVYLPWELADENGTPRSVEQRTTEMEQWVSRMCVKSLRWEKSVADQWVDDVIKPNHLTCCAELLEALNTDHVPRSNWVTNYPNKVLKIRDNATMNILFTLVKAEIQSLGNTASRTVDGHVTGGAAGDSTHALLLAMAIGNQKSGNRVGMGLNMASFPGLAQNVAETKRVRPNKQHKASSSKEVMTEFQEEREEEVNSSAAWLRNQLGDQLRDQLRLRETNRVITDPGSDVDVPSVDSESQTPSRPSRTSSQGR